MRDSGRNDDLIGAETYSGDLEFVLTALRDHEMIKPGPAQSAVFKSC